MKTTTTQNDDVQLAVMQRDLTYLVKSIDIMQKTLDSFPNIYFTIAGHNDFMTSVYKRFDDLDAGQKALSSKAILTSWVKGVGVIVAASAITLLLQFYLQHFN